MEEEVLIGANGGGCGRGERADCGSRLDSSRRRRAAARKILGVWVVGGLWDYESQLRDLQRWRER